MDSHRDLCFWLLVLSGSLLLVPVQSSDVYYSIREGLSPGTVFGNIVDDSDLRRKVSPDDLSKLRFSFLTTGNPNSRYFSVDASTGELSVASKIDRETVCSFRQDCQLTVSQGLRGRGCCGEGEYVRDRLETEVCVYV